MPSSPGPLEGRLPALVGVLHLGRDVRSGPVHHNFAVMYVETCRHPSELPIMRPSSSLFRISGVAALAAAAFLFLAMPTARADWHGRGGWNGGGGWHGGGWGWRGGGWGCCWRGG